MKRIIAIAIVALVAVSGFLWWSNVAQAPTSSLTEADSVTIALGDATVMAAVVDTPESRAQGLSGRAELPEGEGMLFVFQEDGLHSFWMKDMLISIDMIWLSADKTVVHIAENASPESYPSSFAPPQPARYVLEVPAGWSVRHGVIVGSAAQF